MGKFEDNKSGKDEPEIYSLKKGKSGWSLSRRQFLKTAAVSTTALGLAGCTGGGGSSGGENEDDPAEPGDFDTQVCNNIYAHCDKVTSISISNNGEFMATGSLDNHFKLWSLPQGAFIKDYKKDTDILDVKISHDNKLIASAISSMPITLVSLPDGSNEEELGDQQENYYTNKIDISSDGEYLASGNDDGSITLWSLPQKKILHTLSEHTGEIKALCISPDNTILASGDSLGSITLWNIVNGTRLFNLESHDSEITSLKISTDGTRLISTSINGVIKVYILPGGFRYLTKTILNRNFYSLDISRDGSFIAVGSHSDILIYSYPDINSLISFKAHEGEITALAITPDGKTIVSGGGDGAIRMWNSSDGKQTACLMDIQCNTSDVSGITYIVINSSGESETRTIPCGTPIPENAVCSCNCVEGSPCNCVSHSTCSCVSHSTCSCVSHTTCSCVSHSTCSCVSHSTCSCVSHSTCSCVSHSTCSCVSNGHYWYPN